MSTLPRLRFAPWFALLTLSCFLSAPLQAAKPEEAPAAINAHYEWCGEAKGAAAKLKRYEGFWKQRRPAKSDEYDDHPHVTYVRRCGYRLVELYLETGQKEKARPILKWLEKTDETLPENASEPEPEKEEKAEK